MSFAFNAAPFNNNENNSESSIERKRNAKNKTIKRRQAPSQINILKEKLTGMDNDDEDLATFDPPPLPTSAGVNRTKRIQLKMYLYNLILKVCFLMDQYSKRLFKICHL